MTQYDHDAWTYNNDPDNAQLQHNKCKSTPPLLQITNVKVHLQSLLENLILEREEIRHKMMNFRHKYDLRRNL
jgi:hypothetical protein